METLYYIDQEGMLIGGFAGSPPPAGAILVSGPPPHALKYRYVNGAWEKIPDPQGDRQEEYLKAGITDQAVVSAVWEFFSESKSEALDVLKAKKEAIDALIPIP